MAMESFATPYPVIFNDGERDHDKGQVGVHSVLTFKRFQMLLSQKVGLPAAQLSAVFVCRRTVKDTDKRQKLPINDNTNFNIILNQHNPMWEKDCHFLVSLKKSKKERKGTRRRSAEAENGEDDYSVSPRSNTSPKDERPTPEVLVDNGLAEELSTQEPRPVLQLSLPSGNAALGNQRLSLSHLDGKSGSEKILLRRDQSVPNSSLPTEQTRSQVDKQPNQGFTSRETSLTQGLSPSRADIENEEKLRVQSETVIARPMLRSDHNLLAGRTPHQQAVVSRAIEEAQERRLNEAIGVARPTVLLQRSGVLHLPGVVNSNPSLSAAPPLRPVGYHPSVNMVLSRVSNGTPLTLQQAQAQYLNLQAQRPDQMQLNPQALSRMRGVVRDLAAYENGNHKASGVCPHCCTFRERNIIPTPFHLCVHDKVTNGFRGPSPAGPIERPAKRVEAAA